VLAEGGAAVDEEGDGGRGRGSFRGPPEAGAALVVPELVVEEEDGGLGGAEVVHAEVRRLDDAPEEPEDTRRRVVGVALRLDFAVQREFLEELEDEDAGDGRDGALAAAASGVDHFATAAEDNGAEAAAMPLANIRHVLRVSLRLRQIEAPPMRARRQLVAVATLQRCRRDEDVAEGHRRLVEQRVHNVQSNLAGLFVVGGGGEGSFVLGGFEDGFVFGLGDGDDVFGGGGAAVWQQRLSISLESMPAPNFVRLVLRRHEVPVVVHTHGPQLVVDPV